MRRPSRCLMRQKGCLILSGLNAPMSDEYGRIWLANLGGRIPASRCTCSGLDEIPTDDRQYATPPRSVVLIFTLRCTRGQQISTAHGGSRMPTSLTGMKTAADRSKCYGNERTGIHCCRASHGCAPRAAYG